MYYYEIISDFCPLEEKDSFVQSASKLTEFDILVMDVNSKFVTCRIVKEISQFEAVSKEFDIKNYLSKTDVKNYLKEKQAERASEVVLAKVEKKVKSIQFLEKLRKYQSDPDVKVLLDQFENLNNGNIEMYEDRGCDR